MAEKSLRLDREFFGRLESRKLLSMSDEHFLTYLKVMIYAIDNDGMLPYYKICNDFTEELYYG